MLIVKIVNYSSAWLKN